MAEIREIADAVLYEGYLLYPYRHSAIKNRRRWNFGVIYPRAYSDAQGDGNPWTMRTECLAEVRADATLDITVRFLHLLMRSQSRPDAAGVAPAATASRFNPDNWEEGIEREVSLPALIPARLAAAARHVPFSFPAARLVDRAENGAESVREHQALAGEVIVTAESVSAERSDAEGDVYKLTVRVENLTPCPDAEVGSWRDDAALPHAFVSTHTLLRVERGAFISLLDPPEHMRAAAATCRNERTYPVLVGEDGQRDTLLSSPIILYDYPRIAQESPGALFDGTEIDEILTLRILTLTDDEKAEIRAGDDRARAILERTEALTAEQLMKLHGAMRDLRPLESAGPSDLAMRGGDA